MVSLTLNLPKSKTNNQPALPNKKTAHVAWAVFYYISQTMDGQSSTTKLPKPKPLVHQDNNARSCMRFITLTRSPPNNKNAIISTTTSPPTKWLAQPIKGISQ
ncbi:hypothetical protein B0189_02820 [Moraxella cuniculi]|nr:hypothetical protein B0189_02820 [Moraxella cuniculi]